MPFLCPRCQICKLTGKEFLAHLYKKRTCRAKYSDKSIKEIHKQMKSYPIYFEFKLSDTGVDYDKILDDI